MTVEKAVVELTVTLETVKTFVTAETAVMIDSGLSILLSKLSPCY